jgi:hypothetical protein
MLEACAGKLEGQAPEHRIRMGGTSRHLWKVAIPLYHVSAQGSKGA